MCPWSAAKRNSHMSHQWMQLLPAVCRNEISHAVATLKVQLDAANNRIGEMLKRSLVDFKNYTNYKEVWPSISLCQSRSLPVYQDFENRKNTKGSPLWNGKKFLSPISLKFYVWDPLTIRISNFRVFFKKKISKFFHFFLMLEDPQKILTSKISNFLEKKIQK